VIIVDTALRTREQQGKPIRVGMIGAGFMGQGLTNQIVNSVPGMRMAAIYNRTMERALGVYRYAGCEDAVVAGTQQTLDESIRRDIPVVAEDAFAICRSPEIDVLVDVTGSVEFGAQVLLEAFRHGKSVVLMNAEVDSTIGPILRVYARQGGAILSACDGDEPGVQMNLYRWVKGLGLLPRVIGNVKGLQDPYRNPTTQKGWAERWGQNAAMVTSFADGSKISFEQSIVANATGFKVRARGMSRGLRYDGSILDIQKLYDIEELRALGGIVDYTVGPPLIKVFILAEHPDPKQRHYLDLYKMGEGPLYPFWAPYHLVHFEVPNAIARVVLFGDEVAPPLDGPVVEVCAVAKRELQAGEVLDEYGMYTTYGEAVNADEMSAGRYLPEGLVGGCKLRRAIPRDQVLTYGDVELPAGRLADRLRAEQYKRFRGESWLEDLLAGAPIAPPVTAAGISPALAAVGPRGGVMP
jgi:predicted homoserine dehydrogenase-like protein